MHDGGLDLGRWSEGAGRYAERQSDVAIELGEHAEAAVRLAAGRRGQALGHLALEHECHLADGPARAHERHQDRSEERRVGKAGRTRVETVAGKRGWTEGR